MGGERNDGVYLSLVLCHFKDALFQKLETDESFLAKNCALWKKKDHSVFQSVLSRTLGNGHLASEWSKMPRSEALCESLASGCILADEMGLGKTLQCIALVWTLLKQNPWGGGGVVKRVLVVAPSSLTANWGKEFHKWLGKERLQVYVVDNNNKASMGSDCHLISLMCASVNKTYHKCSYAFQVEDFFRQQWSSVLVVSYDQLLRSQDLLCRPSNGFGLVICDEGHRLKNPTSKTSAALAALPIARRVLLTGTPVQNDLQVSGVLVSWCLTDTPVQNCFRFDLMTSGRDGDTSEGGAPQLAEAARQLLPPHLQDPLASSEEDSGKLAVLSCLLWQLSQGKERIVLVSHFTSTLDLLQRLCQRYSYSFTRLDGATPPHKRQHIVDAFNNPHSQTFVFLLSSRAGGVGLNLTGASRILLYDVDWNPATDLQAMARVWRDGQTRTVHIYRLVLSGSVEERMFQRQVQKQGLSGAVVDAGKQSASKVAFSLQELRDLYSPASLGTCVTHAQLACGCDQLGGPCLPPPAPDSAPTRACQLTTSSRSQEDVLCTMDRLYEWQHFSSSLRVPGYLQDECLEAGADFFSMVFRHQTDATAGV
ncbi:Helicase C-terminal [Trinorchestia longiramus]|nr:Helicase C-terminal [Trinorchestia longiramus]